MSEQKPDPLKPDPLNPDREQQLCEKLAMTEEDLNMLNYIRQHVKLINQGQNGTERPDNTDF